MKALSASRRAILGVALSAFVAAPTIAQSPSVLTPAPTADSQGSDWVVLAPTGAGTHILEVQNGRVVCRAATSTESHSLHEHHTTSGLHFIGGRRGGLKPESTAAGLTILLRGTAQLESYPQAQAAFLRAAARWQAVIKDPITVIVDVDFGPNRFGTAYASPKILGATDADLRTGPYRSITQAMINLFPFSQVYRALPFLNLPTDQGTVETLAAPSASLRMLRLMSSVASETETAPSIGFNSAHGFDFDSTDGIDNGDYDFDAVVTHEMGHLLGFDSLVGDLELNPGHPLIASSWDVFRFRPGISFGEFTTTPRVLSSGGDQVFFDGTAPATLSTGRDDGSGGDGHQASHWKDFTQSGLYWGIMEPVLPQGFRASITAWDLDVLSWLGYNIEAASFHQGWISSLTPGTVLGGSPGFVLTVDGSNFENGATVLWKGSDRQTTFVSPTRVTAHVSASDVAAEGKASVEVVNPGAIPSNSAFVVVGSAGELAPSANFKYSPPSPVTGKSIQFQDLSTGSPTSWSWDFGDQTTSSAQNPSKIYSMAGSYEVTLRVSNNAGTDSVSMPVVVSACRGCTRTLPPRPTSR